MASPDISALIAQFLATYDAAGPDKIWEHQMEVFRTFWYERILGADANAISDDDCDEIIRILDRNGKGNTSSSESVAKAMIPQGAWRRMLNELHSNRPLGTQLTKVLEESDPKLKAGHIDALYKLNEGQRNFLTGNSCNAVGAFLAAYDPKCNLSIISLNDRRAVINYLELVVSFDWDTTSIGTRMVETNTLLLNVFSARGLVGTAKTITRFCYSPEMKALWKGEHKVETPNKVVNVIVPTESEPEPEACGDELRESFHIQALLAEIGAQWGFSIWLPKADRGPILKIWKPEVGQLVDKLPLGFETSTIKTIEQIDVIWLRKRSIVRAFEVEHTTSVYSGLLRMADLVALQPNIAIRLHIVAPAHKRDKVMQEIQRPVFSLLEGRGLSEMCSFLSYDGLRQIKDLPHLAHLNDSVMDEYVEHAESLD